VVPGEELACRNSIFAEVAFGFEHLNLHARVGRIDKIDEVDKGIINGLV
jgi:hypothetical protein